MLAIKWKNNSVKGILLVLVCAMLASTAMCNAYPMFREKAQANITEMKQKQQEQQLFLQDVLITRIR